jgi:hypothetical protein
VQTAGVVTLTLRLPSASVPAVVAALAGLPPDVAVVAGKGEDTMQSGFDADPAVRRGCLRAMCIYPI